MNNLSYLAAGTFFGFILIKSEVISWFRIQEMFRFQDFHMYGIIGSALAVGMLSIWLIKKLDLKAFGGEAITLQPKDPRQLYRYILGGSLFGFGWALTGACPGPLFALAGSGYSIMLVPLAFAILGTLTYGLVRNRLPHTAGSDNIKNPASESL